MIYLGIDPGFSGAVGFYNTDTKLPTLVCDMPLHEVRGKRHLDLHTLSGFLAVFQEFNPAAMALIEDPHAMPKQGVSSMFRFGHCCGAVQGIVVALSIPMHLVKPAVWKPKMGLTRDKDASRQLASRMWPSRAALWSREKDDGRAEACLLAYYGSTLKAGAARQ